MISTVVSNLSTDAVTVSPLQAPFQADRVIPLVQPANGVVDLAQWVELQKSAINAALLQHGAVFFRGFGINNPPAFERFALSICPDLFKENSEHVPVSENGNVQTPVFFPAYQKLLWHNENSFNRQWPLKILFACMQPPIQGGETPLVDSRMVFQQLDESIRAEFRAKQVMYVRNYAAGMGLSWQTVFRTEHKGEVEAQCQAQGIQFTWKGDDELQTRMVRPAIGQHPQSGEDVWFNQAQHWHIACLDEDTRESIVEIFDEEEYPRHCYFGDGSPIDDAIMQEICRIYEQLEIVTPWQAGDAVVIDNMLMAHARNPYAGERKLLVAMGEMIDSDAL